MIWNNFTEVVRATSRFLLAELHTVLVELRSWLYSTHTEISYEIFNEMRRVLECWQQTFHENNGTGDRNTIVKRLFKLSVQFKACLSRLTKAERNRGSSASSQEHVQNCYVRFRFSLLLPRPIFRTLDYFQFGCQPVSNIDSLWTVQLRLILCYDFLDSFLSNCILLEANGDIETCQSL